MYDAGVVIPSILLLASVLARFDDTRFACHDPKAEVVHDLVENTRTWIMICLTKRHPSS